MSSTIVLPADDEATESDPLVQLGTSGLKEFSGTIFEEFLVRLRGRKGVRFYKEMGDNSTALATALYVIKILIGQVEWRLEPADESEASQAQAEFMEGVLFEDMNTTWEDLLEEILSFLQFGWSYFELVYKVRRGPDAPSGETRSRFDDGKWGLRKIEIRGQETLDRWVFDEQGGIRGMVQLNTHSIVNRHAVFLPIEKCLLFRTTTHKGNPEGQSFFRPAVLPYNYSKRIQEFEAIGVERDLAGMPIFEVPPELLNANAPADLKAMKSQFERFVTQVRRDERWGGLVPSELKPDGSPTGYKFKLLTTGGRRQIDTNTILQRYNKEMLMLFLEQFLMFGMDGGGNRSLGETMTELFAKSLNSIMDKITAVFNRFAIPRLMELNNVPQDNWPILQHADAKDVDLEALANYVTSLAQAGQLPDSMAIKRQLLEDAGLPQPEEEEMDEHNEDSGPPEPLQGGQVEALLSVLDKIRTMSLPTDAAVEVLLTTFPISRERAEKLVAAMDKIAEEPPEIPMGPPGNLPQAPMAPAGNTPPAPAQEEEDG